MRGLGRWRCCWRGDASGACDTDAGAAHRAAPAEACAAHRAASAPRAARAIIRLTAWRDTHPMSLGIGCPLGSLYNILGQLAPKRLLLPVLPDALMYRASRILECPPAVPPPIAVLALKDGAVGELIAAIAVHDTLRELAGVRCTACPSEDAAPLLVVVHPVPVVHVPVWVRELAEPMPHVVAEFTLVHGTRRISHGACAGWRVR